MASSKHSLLSMAIRLVVRGGRDKLKINSVQSVMAFHLSEEILYYQSHRVWVRTRDEFRHI